jgi:hypothetical protein
MKTLATVGAIVLGVILGLALGAVALFFLLYAMFNFLY